MSSEDRSKWNARYLDGAYESRTHPSALLVKWQDRLPVGRALDVASGAGRNALWLAERGYEVTAVDISDVGLRRLAERAGAAKIETVELDLDQGFPIKGPFNLIIKMRFLSLKLVPTLVERLDAGGVLVCEVLLQSGLGDAAPAPSSFRAAPGALLVATHGLEIMYYDEGPVADPDGRTVFLARLIGRRR